MSVKLGEAHAPLNKLVADAIRERIFRGDLAPGVRLVEARLSEELGVSRMPVREALRQLANEGLITLEPRRGATVAVFGDEQVREVVEVRAALEALAARFAAKRVRPSHLAELQQCLDDDRRAAAAGAADATGAMGAEPAALRDHEARARHDRFHEAIAQAADNVLLAEMLRTMRERAAMIVNPVRTAQQPGYASERAELVRAIGEANAELAALLAARHVYSSVQSLPGWQVLGELEPFNPAPMPRRRLPVL